MEEQVEVVAVRFEVFIGEERAEGAVPEAHGLVAALLKHGYDVVWCQINAVNLFVKRSCQNLGAPFGLVRIVLVHLPTAADAWQWKQTSC